MDDDRCEEFRRIWGKWQVDNERNRFNNEVGGRVKRIENVRRVYGTNERQDVVVVLSPLTSSSSIFGIELVFNRFKRDDRKAFTWQEGTERNRMDKFEDLFDDLNEKDNRLSFTPENDWFTLVDNHRMYFDQLNDTIDRYQI